MKEFFAKLKSLFEDRPPPPAAEPPPVEAASDVQPPPTVEAVPSREVAAVDPDELAEVRAALEAVADPVRAPEPEAELFPTPDPMPAPAPVPTPSTPESPHEAPLPTSVGQVGDALVLALGTPSLTFTVAKTSATLGRGQENTIRLDDLSVSRRHARIAYRQGGYWLSDLGSMGGTWVEGTRLNAPRRLAAGEVIDIGLCRLTVGFAGGVAKDETKRSASKTRSEVAGQVKRRR